MRVRPQPGDVAGGHVDVGDVEADGHGVPVGVGAPAEVLYGVPVVHAPHDPGVLGWEEIFLNIKW